MSDSANIAPGKQEWIYSDLRAQLEDGRRGPGDKLVIAQLAEEFGVSPIPVREAIRRLEADGWVTFKPHIGAEVAELTQAAWANAVEVLAVVEGRATALAAPNLSAEEIAALRLLNLQMRQRLECDDGPAFGVLNRRFHEVFRDRCGNSWLTRMLVELQPRFDALGPGYLRPRAAAAVAEHTALIELIEQRADPVRIEAAARRHKLNTAGIER